MRATAPRAGAPGGYPFRAAPGLSFGAKLLAIRDT